MGVEEALTPRPVADKAMEQANSVSRTALINAARHYREKLEEAEKILLDEAMLKNTTD